MDWIVHLVSAFFILKFVKRKYDVRYTPIFVGTILPDINKIDSLLKIFIDPATSAEITIPLHTPVVTSLIAISIAPFFQGEKRAKNCLILTLIGVGSHYFLDLFVMPFGGGIHFLWPISYHVYRFGLFWKEDSIPTVIALTALAIYFAITKFICIKEQKRNC